MKKALLLTIGLFVSLINLHAQDSTPEETPEYIETKDKRDNAYHFYKKQILIAEPSLLSIFGSFNNSGKKNYILNADVRSPIGIGGRWFTLGSRKKYWMSYFEVLPDIKIRIFRDDQKWGDTSMPVRTPSLRVGASYFGAPKSWWHHSERPDKHYVGLTVYHHSNGQDGAELINDSVNLYNGNFGEQVVLRFFYGGIFQGVSNELKQFSDLENKSAKIRQARQTAIERNHLWYWRAGFEFHAWEKWGTSETFKKYNIYGRHRVQLKGGFISSPRYTESIYNGEKWVPVPDRTNIKKELWRVILNVEYITDLKYNSGLNVTQLEKQRFFDPTKRLNIDLTGYLRCPGVSTMAFFARASYIGSDNYNIYFQNSYGEIRLGIAFASFYYPRN
ncbi:MAG: hypothetical protein HRT58_00025 [Crocinitomicaceae bacterium]|nr:hypothetical protein [Flavobacteriales bacterium]NQZ34006.1 hypothetical protein [Crocinitomicaceae bacterium]